MLVSLSVVFFVSRFSCCQVLLQQQLIPRIAPEQIRAAPRPAKGACG